MRHRGRGVKVIGFLQFLTPETRWFAVGIGSILSLDNILIYFRSPINSFSNEKVIFLSCVIS